MDRQVLGGTDRRMHVQRDDWMVGCLEGWTDRWKAGGMGEWMVDGWVDGHMDGWKDGWVDG